MAVIDSKETTRRWLEAFVAGFSETRSLTHPYNAAEIYPSIWLLSDAPRRSGPYRKSEYIAFGHMPEVVMRAIRASGSSRINLCIMSADQAGARIEKERYKQLGFRYLGAEPLFVADLGAYTPPSPCFDIRRVTTRSDADRIRTAARGRQISAANLASSTPKVRLYSAFAGDTPLGWVRSVTTHGDRAWVSNLFVRSESRGQGIGRSLITCMQQDDVRHGIRYSVLLASSAGARLYPHVGYVERGVLTMFTGHLTTVDG